MALPIFAGIGAGLGAISSIGQIFTGNRQRKRAEQALNDFEFQELENVFEDMPISTVGSDIKREEASRTTAGMVDAARSGGVRSVLSALPRIQQYSNDVNNDIAMDLDNQIRERNRLIAEDKSHIRSMQEQRDRDELAGLGQQLAVGQQNFMSGMNNLANVGMSAASMFGNSTTTNLSEQQIALNEANKRIESGIGFRKPYTNPSNFSVLSSNPLFDLYKPKAGGI